ncbi:SlyX family protein [Jannaschia marina]|uniref:SlyX family protein n=1 Tax=Jannaschia marina TaxID=2741674 RepID=UPI0015C97193|nr:SlyX family protein [Jannaschia marina]
MQDLEERIAHLTRLAEDLSDVVARQDRQIAALESRVTRLMQRAAEQEAEAGGSVTIANERPPHW